MPTAVSCGWSAPSGEHSDDCQAPAARHQPDCFEIAPQTSRAQSVAVDQQWHQIGEGPRGAGLLPTPKPTDEQLDRDLAISNGQIGNGAAVTALQRFRAVSARWTKRAQRCQANRQMHNFTTELYLLENEP
jgi:hypothetical protein